MTLLLDTDVLSRLRRLDRAPPKFGSWAATMQLDTAYVSAITLMEMEDGILSVERRDPGFARQLRHWQNEVLTEFASRIIAVDAVVAMRLSRLKTVRSIAVADGLIAATALEHDLLLVAHNIRYFSGYGLKLLDPLAP